MTSKESSIYQNYESHSNKWGIFLYYNQTIKIFYFDKISANISNI